MRTVLEILEGMSKTIKPVAYVKKNFKLKGNLGHEFKRGNNGDGMCEKCGCGFEDHTYEWVVIAEVDGKNHMDSEILKELFEMNTAIEDYNKHHPFGRIRVDRFELIEKGGISDKQEIAKNENS